MGRQGLLSLLLAEGIAADVQSALATVVVPGLSGLTISPLLTLFVFPAVYVSVEERLRHIRKRPVKYVV